jgi:hypothetical protein
MASRGEMGKGGGMNLQKTGGRNEILFSNKTKLIY